MSPDSKDAEEIQTRLDRNDPEKLSPFYLLRPFTVERGKEKICYDGYDEHYTLGKPDVVVEIEVTDYNYCIPLRICREGTPDGKCPISKRTFQSGDAVYISNSDSEKVRSGEPVGCTSVHGLRAVTSSAGDTMKKGKDGQYSMYFLFDEAPLRDGICDPNAGARSSNWNFERIQLAPIYPEESEDTLIASMAYEMGIHDEAGSSSRIPVYTLSPEEERSRSREIMRMGNVPATLRERVESGDEDSGANEREGEASSESSQDERPVRMDIFRPNHFHFIFIFFSLSALCSFLHAKEQNMENVLKVEFLETSF